MLAPILLLTVVDGCFGLLPLLGVISGVWAMARRTPDDKQLAADVRLMEAAGLLLVNAHELMQATYAAKANPALRQYVSRYHGRLYLSLDFIADPDERLAAWNALWKFQAGTADSTDRDLAVQRAALCPAPP